ncbi:MAG: putative LPS assembly protein LptD, partial [Rikenellaceae bacterium]
SKGRYTTCDADHPHFYIAMPTAKFIPGEKVVVGPSYMVMEDVPLYFLGVPFGFFPIDADRSSGFIIPSYGEETVKGFYLRNGGYYYAINDYIDMTLLGGFYTLGSWETSLQTRYSKRYRYSGSLKASFSKDIIGEEDAADYVNMNNFSMTWSHQQDAKFKPNSTFAASVNFSTSGYAKYGSTTLEDYLNTQTNSSVSYSKKWDDKPFSLSMSLQHSQNSTDTTVSLSLPNLAFNMSRIYPFQRKNVIGSQRWYEKISLTYTSTFANSVTVHESDLFTQTMMNDLKSGVKHTIPVSTSFNLFNYISISPNVSYNERWYFKKIQKEWNPETETVETTDTLSGFYRVYDYSVSASASTSVYGMYTVKNPNSWLKAVRHMMTPSISVSYRPDFGQDKYGYYETVQSDADGSTTTYSPYESSMYGVPSSGESASLSFSLQNSLEMKVRSERDTSGVKKISLIDNFSLSGSYNFLADSLNLSTIALSFRTTLTKSLGLNVSATLDPYQVSSTGTRINKFMWSDGKIGRLSSVSTSFGYSFNSKGSNSTPSVNDINSQISVPSAYTDPYNTDEYNNLDPNQKRMLMTSSYYDFDIPWNIGFNYSFSFSNTGVSRSVTQTLGFNGSVNLTPKWGIAFNGGFDFEMQTLTPGTFTLSRDLHCWQMSFSWIPTGYRQSWGFTISAKSSLLQDLKYEKNSSYYDNLYDY